MEKHDIPQGKNKTTKEKKITKKTKIRYRSSSSTRSNTDKIDEQLELASEIFLQNEVSSINKHSLKYILENFSNKNINIHGLCNQVGSNASNIQNLIEQIRPHINRPQHIYDLQPSILCLQETNLKNNHSASIKNYTGYFKNRTNALRASGRVATFMKDTIDSENIPIISDLEAIATLVKFKKH